jgi:peptidoglycan/LPS O-acetylase OafA/YrhL
MQILGSRRALTGKSSIFLDGIRLLSALTVLATHTRALWYPELELDAFSSNLSHGAVVIFFVLSGFVIAHTTGNNNRGVKEYAVARLSRLYSVFLPAIFITIICSSLVWAINPSIYDKYDQNNMVFRYIISIFFCNEIWFFSAAPLINGPIWSLSYEFWYYVIFGAFFYRHTGIKGWVIPLIVCLIAGPKILMLMAMWFLGWLVYHLPKPAIGKSFLWLMLIGLLLLSFYMMIYLPSLPNNVNTTRLHWADKFISDFLVSLVVGAAFYFLPDGTKNSKVSKSVMNFRRLADLTFPIYVLHFPLLVLSQCLLIYVIKDINVLFWCSLVSVFICCGIIGLGLEKYRKSWSAFFKKIIYNISSLKLSS